MAELTTPVVRRQPGDPLLYLMVNRSASLDACAMAFRSLEDVARSGWIVWAWQTDEHGDYAPVTRPG